MAPQPDTDRREEKRARALASALAGFSARARHDLVGPLNQASSLVALFVHRHKGASDPHAAAGEADPLLDFLQTTAAKIQSVVGGMEPFLKIAASAPVSETVDLNDSLAVAQERLASAIAESGAAIAHDSLPVIAGNGDQMVTLFEILIGNAIKFRKPGEPASVRISARRSGDEWIVAVADQGIGIDEEFREAVFLPFRRLHGKEYPGAGMGLATAKLIVGLHGGEIRIESADTDGTAVIFTAPVLDSAADR